MGSKIIIPPKPPSEIFKGYGLSRTPLPTDTITLHAIRDNFTLSTWLLIGASLQCILFLPFLHIRPSYAILPALSLLSFRLVRGVLMCVGAISHQYADGMLPGKRVAVLPPAVEIDGLKKDDDEGGICVIMLFARCHSPLGILAPHYATLSAQMRTLIHNLDASSPSNGFLGGSSFTNACTRTTTSEVMTLAYFSSHASLQAFAHGPEHRKVWEWWNELGRKKEARHISIAHEVFKARKGEWEGIYVNQVPSFLAATQHLVKEGEDYQWVSPLADAKGRYRSALGRMGKSNGDDNEVYGDDPWDNV